MTNYDKRIIGDLNKILPGPWTGEHGIYQLYQDGVCVLVEVEIARATMTLGSFRNSGSDLVFAGDSAEEALENLVAEMDQWADACSRLASGVDYKLAYQTIRTAIDARCTIEELRQLVGLDPTDEPVLLAGSDIGEGRLNVGHWMAKLLASSFIDWLDQEGVENFLTSSVEDKRDGRAVEVTIQRAGKKTTADTIRELREALAQKEEHIDRLTTAMTVRHNSCETPSKMSRKMTSKPEPPPQKGKESVNAKLMNWLAERRDMKASMLVLARAQFGLEKYGTALETHNGRDAVEDARQEIGDALQYVMQAKMEGRDMADLRELTQTLLELIEADALESYEEDLG